jgi:ubiquinone biosynthesis protein Coq4
MQANFSVLIFRQRLKYTKYYLPWAIRTGREAQFLLNVYWEKRWEQSLSDLHKELNIQPFVEPLS